MPLAKSKNKVGLGNSLMNDRFGKGKGQDMRRGPKGIQRTAPDGSTYITTPKEEAAWMKMRSVTEQAALDEFLSTAELAGTDFTAEKLNNVKIIHPSQKNPYLLSAAEERAAVQKHNKNRRRLKVPRRPPWDEKMSRSELDEREREALLEWRRGLADLQEDDDLLMTPFERNIEVWRQLWRVIERSDLIVQIVDARNPLLFRCEDLESYVKDVDSRKNNLLLVNKADMMTVKQRKIWADYFEEREINFRFFSAELAKEVNNVRDEGDSSSGEDISEFSSDEELDEAPVKDWSKLAQAAKRISLQEKADEEEQWVDEERNMEDQADKRIKIITTDELEALFLEHAPEIEPGQDPSRKTTIGLVGYPNVGKSSTINALIGAKKVSVSATPGKTKHFQTIHLSPSVILCDCPGLVFPNFATTKAELVANGVLPIDQLREYSGPAGLVAQRIPQAYLEAIYGMKIAIRPLEEGGTGIPTAEELLSAYARARGFFTQGLGQPDESRAVRYVLKDYVKGKLLFCHPPPRDPPIDAHQFNRGLYDVAHLPLKRRAALAAEEEAILDNESTFSATHDEASETQSDAQGVSLMDHPSAVPSQRMEGSKSQRLDTRFFGPARSNAGHVKLPPHLAHQQLVSEEGTGSGKQLSGRKLKTMIALERGIDPSEVKAGGKKHFKGEKRKVRGAGGYE